MVREVISTPLPTSDSGRVRFRCDNCGVVGSSHEPDELPCAPWRYVTAPGWVGDFVACSDACARKIKRALIRARLASAIRKAGFL